MQGRLGTVYRGGAGQWTWALHRITGIGVFLFLLAHILDTALVAFGEEAYNRVIAIYTTPVVKLFEIGLAGMVLFHALNGVRITVIDFFPRTARYHKQLSYAVVILFFTLMIPATFFMGRSILKSL